MNINLGVLHGLEAECWFYFAQNENNLLVGIQNYLHIK